MSYSPINQSSTNQGLAANAHVELGKHPAWLVVSTLQKNQVSWDYHSQYMEKNRSTPSTSNCFTLW